MGSFNFHVKLKRAWNLFSDVSNSRTLLSKFPTNSSFSDLKKQTFKMAFLKAVNNFAYHAIFKRYSTYVGFIIVGAFAFERGIDDLGDYIWYSHNRGKIFHDIRHQYDKTDE